MTLKKSIEILTHEQDTGDFAPKSDYRTALSMGIEALRRIRTLRAEPHLSAQALLPSETES